MLPWNHKSAEPVKAGRQGTSDPERPGQQVRHGEGNRAGCLETCTSGSQRGMKKPDPETGQGASFLLYPKSSTAHGVSRGGAYGDFSQAYRM